MSGYDAVNTGVYYALISETSLTDLLATYLSEPAIFDEAPQSEDGAKLTDFPYLTFSTPSYLGWDTDTETGSESIIQIDVWSRTGNNEECNLIMDAIKNTLHRQELTIAGANFLGCDLNASSVNIDPDGITRHGVQRYLIRVED